MALNRWDQPGVPHTGWQCVNVIDLGDIDGNEYTPATCEMCGQESLRYVHTMHHPRYPELNVGCVCAGKMESDAARAVQREKKLSNRAKRKGHWLKRKWGRTRKGDPKLTIQGFRMGVSADQFHSGKWRWWIMTTREDCPKCRISYNTADQAKLALFDAIADFLDW